MATWAKGIDFKNSANTARVGGVGMYGNDTASEKIYIGFGTEPWNNTGLQVTKSGINYKGNKIYHAGDKPSLNELGAAASSHNHAYITGANSNKIQVDQPNDFAGLEKKNNVNIDSWYGFSISNKCSGQSVPLDGVAFSVNARNGAVWAKGTVTAPTFSGALSGNSTTATTLQTSRTINGTSFNGSANITTANWGTARTLTIGNTGKSVNGSGNVSWSLSEIGAAASSHSHSNYVSGSNDTATVNCSGGLDRTKSKFFRHNGTGLNGGLGIHVAHSESPEGHHSRGITFNYGSSNGELWTYGYNENNVLAYQHNLWHSGNFNPDTKSNSSHSHSNYLSRGSWDTNGGQDLLVHGKRALVGLPDGTLYLGYGGDFSNVYVNNNTIWHSGNFNPNGKLNTDNATIGGDGIYNNGWYRCNGNQGIYFQQHGGGWHMTDGYWIRAYGGKSIYSSGEITADSQMSTNLMKADRIRGRNRGGFYLGDSGAGRIEATSDSYVRLYTSEIGVSDKGIRISADGSVSFLASGVIKHEFRTNGTKVGGTIDIEGITYGMSPTDSPRSLIEDIIFDKEITGITKIELNQILSSSFDKYAVFASNNKVEILEKHKNYFIAQADKCISDFRIVGTRIDCKDQYYEIMGGIVHGTEETATK